MKFERTPVSQDQLKSVTQAFALYGDFVSGAPYGSGHINDTFAIHVNQGGSLLRYIFQRINHGIFQNPAELMDNIARVCAHNLAVSERAEIADSSRRVMSIIPARSGEPYVRDADGYYWRCYVFIEQAKTYDQIESPQQAFEAAKAFGDFQQLLADIGGERLHETIPDFHNTAARYQNLVRAIEADPCNRAASVRDEIAFFTQREKDASRLLRMMEAGQLPERVTHNDCKLNNVMIDDETGAGICVIDLDTTMPGLALYDFGDLVRTATSPALEDEPDTSKVVMQMPMFEALVKGYLQGTGSMLNSHELAELPFAGKLITLETGMRFLADYLEGDQYFKIKREGHNLDRCRTQIALVQSIEQQFEAMNDMVTHTNKENTQ
ncbi:aminoglycoside phosphotransferase family protein [Coraliomargarita sp. SDUM461003]|uniref:Aminoglycoside phosphotransferase family protein n=1 Tax=Thalassobacterium maritimum TaxID=3041265 RepID=A0ABU1AU88_9BACT|nr:aminoglycoside phosphotransferase family protein [Coraliomargarita sp. SDUM461003]MDQ8206690.1 aminoglycoside phosphotransferase family protein [Coraliomargarita sp. SDUM461003]